MEPSSSFLAYSTILPTLLFSVSQIILHAIVPQVIVELVCLHESGSENCDGSDVSAKASLLNLVSATIISVPNVLVIGFYASFSKRYGLKPTLLTPVLGNFVFLSLVYLAKLWPTFYRPLIMVGSLVSGLSGSRNTFMLATFAYAADVSAPEERSNVFSIIESAIYTARVFCPLTIGMLSHRHGFGFTLGLGAAVCFINMCWIHFAMRDPGTVYAPGGTDCGGWPAWAAGGGGMAKSDGSSSSSSGRGSSASGKGGGGGSRGPVAAVVDMVAGLLYGNIGYVSSPSPVVSPDGADRALQSDAMERHADRAAGTAKSSKSVAGDGSIENAGGETPAPSEGGKAVSWHDGGEPALAHMPSPLPGQPDEPPMHQQHMSVGAARPSEKLAWHPLETFRSVSKVFGKNSIGNATVPFVAATYFVYHMVVVGVHTVEILFVKYVFKWGADSIGLFGSIHGLMEILSMLAMPVVVSKVLVLSLTDLNWIELGLFARALFFGLFGVVRSGSELFLILTLLVLCGPVVPRIKSYLSKSVDPDQSNDLFAALAGIDALSAFVSPLFTAVYFHTLTVAPGLVFELVAVLFLLCAMVVLSVRRGFGREMLDYLPTTGDAGRDKDKDAKDGSDDGSPPLGPLDGSPVAATTTSTSLAAGLSRTPSAANNAAGAGLFRAPSVNPTRAPSISRAPGSTRISKRLEW